MCSVRERLGVPIHGGRDRAGRVPARLIAVMQPAERHLRRGCQRALVDVPAAVARLVPRRDVEPNQSARDEHHVQRTLTARHRCHRRAARSAVFGALLPLHAPALPASGSRRRGAVQRIRQLAPRLLSCRCKACPLVDHRKRSVARRWSVQQGCAVRAAAHSKVDALAHPVSGHDRTVRRAQHRSRHAIQREPTDSPVDERVVDALVKAARDDLSELDGEPLLQRIKALLELRRHLCGVVLHRRGAADGETRARDRLIGEPVRRPVAVQAADPDVVDPVPAERVAPQPSFLMKDKALPRLQDLGQRERIALKDDIQRIAQRHARQLDALAGGGINLLPLQKVGEDLVAPVLQEAARREGAHVHDTRVRSGKLQDPRNGGGRTHEKDELGQRRDVSHEGAHKGHERCGGERCYAQGVARAQLDRRKDHVPPLGVRLLGCACAGSSGTVADHAALH
eukprot:1648602-Prymnesium_polylepis.2